MTFLVTDRYDPDPFHPFKRFATLADAEAWTRKMARLSGGSAGDLLILGPCDTVPLSVPLSCHCDEGNGWGAQH
jgi:hypothetical protein